MASLGPFKRSLPSSEGLKLIIQDLTNLVLTTQGERLWRAGLGIGTREVLFDPADEVTRSIIKRRLEKQIPQIDPRIIVQDIQLEYDLDVEIPTLNIAIFIAQISDPAAIERIDLLLPIGG